jgi:AraC family transcriptional regulator of adaptative response/methylated-DNA-[protein]-cysteine methyltransferase
MNTTLTKPGDEKPLDESECWKAFLNRDSQADGTFVVAVRSTRIYCRPTCPARRPKPENVRFLRSPEEAEREGYRACLRCRPNTVAAMSEAVRRICRYIEENCDEPIDLSTLSALTDLSPSHLQRTFKRIMGVSPREYADACRIERFKGSVKAGDSITGAMFEAGYGSTSRLYERTTTQLGMTPTSYKKGGKGMLINYSITTCPLGLLLVAATEKGVCKVTLGDDPAAMESALRNEYPAATLAGNLEGLQGMIDSLIQYMDGKTPSLELPLDIQATAFQWRVWKALQSIPYGSTQSYAQVAEAIGRPTAMRAVAQACASNPVALVIPCHRVVRSDGSLSGYRWGVERKQALLDQERKGTSN